MEPLLSFPVARVTLPDADDPMALSLNENPFPPLPSVQAAMVRAAAAANRYPEFLPVRLRNRIADHLGVHQRHIAVGAGATGVLMQILRTFTEPGQRIVLGYPTFDGYPIFAQIARLICQTVPLDDNGHHDLDAMAEAAGDARVVVLCRPHNPTGTLEPESAVRQFLARVPRTALVVLDEAYVEFLDPAHRIDIVALVEDFPNVIVVRTFSKAYGLSDIRTGYAYCTAELAHALWTTQLPFGSSNISLAAVDEIYRCQRQLRQRITAINDERCYLHSRLKVMGTRVFDSHANFVFLPSYPLSPPELLDATGIHVRGYAGGIRVTVGTRQSTRVVLAALRYGMTV